MTPTALTPALSQRERGRAERAETTESAGENPDIGLRRSVLSPSGRGAQPGFGKVLQWGWFAGKGQAPLSVLQKSLMA